ncbi:MAG TPA: sigma-54 dependent transcriptional regulator [Vicinamibacteria bacterium]|nr:sigma-54 dependent transcriptional regulator [Vicinamibacteria bacterium]
MRVLVVDDDPDILRFVEAALAAQGHEAVGVASAEQALAQVGREPPDALLTDIRLEGMDGLQLLAEVRRGQPELPVIVMTSHASVKTAVEAMRRGAVDFVQKPLGEEDLARAMGGLARLRRLENENRWMRRELQEAYAPARIVAVSEPMRRVVATVEKLAHSDVTVLITGESGTGKDLVARALHFGGRRAAGPFVALSCAALPAGLVEAELFGHARGSFTGAVAERAGRLEAAHGGTLFLDEVGELPLEVQPKLLRALETRAFERIGENRVRQTDVRLVAATHRDLRQMVREGRFREDLYFRLAVVPIHIPPLRERPDDLAPLVRYLLTRISEEPPAITDGALEELQRRPLAGNVRELANLLEAAVALHEGDGPLTEADFAGPPASSASAAEIDIRLPAAGVALDDVVRAVLLHALERNGGNKSAAARWLRIPRHLLRFRMEKLGIDSSDPES